MEQFIKDIDWTSPQSIFIALVSGIVVSLGWGFKHYLKLKIERHFVAKDKSVEELEKLVSEFNATHSEICGFPPQMQVVSTELADHLRGQMRRYLVILEEARLYVSEKVGSRISVGVVLMILKEKKSFMFYPKGLLLLIGNIKYLVSKKSKDKFIEKYIVEYPEIHETFSEWHGYFSLKLVEEIARLRK